MLKHYVGASSGGTQAPTGWSDVMTAPPGRVGFFLCVISVSERSKLAYVFKGCRE